jgi:CheY-like chemotaxis protein
VKKHHRNRRNSAKRVQLPEMLLLFGQIERHKTPESLSRKSEVALTSQFYGETGDTSQESTTTKAPSHERIGSLMRRILIIDDEDDIREVAALSLEATAGWQILTASSGAEGISIAAAEHPDAILMDVMMPGVDGPTTFSAMQQNPAIANIPVLLLTAKVQGVDQRRFAGLGLAGILFKPFDPLTLAEQISEVLGWKD